jgi:hypothetical protein
MNRIAGTAARLPSTHHLRVARALGLFGAKRGEPWIGCGMQQARDRRAEKAVEVV